MKIPFRFRIIIEIVGAFACAFVIKKYGYIPMGVFLGIMLIIFADLLFPDERDFRD